MPSSRGTWQRAGTRMGDQQVSHPAPKHKLLAAAVERAAHDTQGAGAHPAEPAAPGAHGTAPSCLALPTPQAEGSSQPSSTQSTRYQRTRRGRAQPTALVPGHAPSATGRVGDGPAAGRTAAPRRRGARPEPEPPAMVPARAVGAEVHKSCSHRDPKSQRSREGESSPRAPAPPLPARATRSRTGCWFDLLPRSRGTL